MTSREERIEELNAKLNEVTAGSLYVNVDYNDLADKVGHDEALKILNELRVLLT